MASSPSLSLPVASTPLTEKERQIIRQVEHYFGDYNLPKDKFMKEIMERNHGWIGMDTMLTFRRLSRLSNDPEEIFAALAKSRTGLLQMDEEGGRLRRDPNVPLPEQSEERNMALQERTVYVSGFSRTGTTLDDLIAFFEGGFEKVQNVRMRYRRATAAHGRDYRREAGSVDENNNIIHGETPPVEARRYDPGEFLGSVFVTFATRQAADVFLRCPISFRGRRLFTQLQRDYFVARPEHNDTFDAAALPRTVWVHGFDDTRITEEMLADFFGDFEGAVSVRKRVFRERRDEPWGFTGAVFVVFGTEKDAKSFVEGADKLAYKGDRLKVKMQEEFYRDKGFFKREFAEVDGEARKQGEA